ncbi:hypothetical protein TK45_14610 [Bowmanella sp. JS7-9]|nr:uracil-DNA glycosylase family protein [Bowmanella sp. JS7-9]TBX20544.1 hypothetical protein TK45_14610 [Bowmanella sp. JS7-9]
MQQLLKEIHQCQTCAGELPFSPQPIIQLDPKASILIIGHAPGMAAHKSATPWRDPSGVRLRDWMGISEQQFYDASQVAIMPMGFCYPGKGRSGDLPPRKECAPQWHNRTLAKLPNVKLTLIIGSYAQAYYLGNASSLTDKVKSAAQFLPANFPLPHPSPRNNLWLARHPWFERDILPTLRANVQSALGNI